MVYDFIENKQILHYQNPNWKAYKSLAIDTKKQYLFAGEGVAKQGEMHVFRYFFDSSMSSQNSPFNLEQVMVMKGHKYGIKSIICDKSQS